LQSRFDPRFAGWLLAGLALTSAVAEAQSGFTITRSREDAILNGMSAAEVRQLLGRPARDAKYPNSPGPTWTYNVVDPLFGRTEFNIDFGPDQRVISKNEMVIGIDKPNL
jgi:hypothetical protein